MSSDWAFLQDKYFLLLLLLNRENQHGDKTLLPKHFIKQSVRETLLDSLVKMLPLRSAGSTSTLRLGVGWGQHAW